MFFKEFIKILLNNKVNIWSDINTYYNIINIISIIKINMDTIAPVIIVIILILLIAVIIVITLKRNNKLNNKSKN